MINSVASEISSIQCWPLDKRTTRVAQGQQSLFIPSIFAGRNKRRTDGGDTTFRSKNGRRSADRASIEMENAASLRSDAHFHRMFWRERKRSERSDKTLLLLVIGRKASIGVKGDVAFLRQAVDCVTDSVRETDFAGWFETDAVFGVLFTELGDTEITAATNVIQAKVMASLQRSFEANQLTKLLVSFHPFPHGWEGTHYREGRSANPALHPSLFDRGKGLPLVVTTCAP